MEGMLTLLSLFAVMFFAFIWFYFFNLCSEVSDAVAGERMSYIYDVIDLDIARSQ